MPRPGTLPYGALSRCQEQRDSEDRGGDSAAEILAQFWAARRLGGRVPGSVLYSCNKVHHCRKGHQTHSHAKFNQHNPLQAKTLLGAEPNLLVRASSKSEL